MDQSRWSLSWFHNLEESPRDAWMHPLASRLASGAAFRPIVASRFFQGGCSDGLSHFSTRQNRVLDASTGVSASLLLGAARFIHNARLSIVCDAGVRCCVVVGTHTHHKPGGCVVACRLIGTPAALDAPLVNRASLNTLVEFFLRERDRRLMWLCWLASWACGLIGERVMVSGSSYIVGGSRSEVQHG